MSLWEEKLDRLELLVEVLEVDLEEALVVALEVASVAGLEEALVEVLEEGSVEAALEVSDQDSEDLVHDLEVLVLLHHHLLSFMVEDHHW